jgi:hypothetical protein
MTTKPEIQPWIEKLTSSIIDDILPAESENENFFNELCNKISAHAPKQKKPPAGKVVAWVWWDEYKFYVQFCDTEKDGIIELYDQPPKEEPSVPVSKLKALKKRIIKKGQYEAAMWLNDEIHAAEKEQKHDT